MNRFSGSRLIVVTFVVLATAGCGRSPAPPDANPPAAADAGDDDISLEQEKLENLRSLGYLLTAGLPKLGAGKGVTILEPKLVSPGETLVVFAGACAAQLLSPAGEVLRSWSESPCHRWDHAEPLPGGDIVVVGSRMDEDVAEDPIESGRHVMRLSRDGRVVWRLDIAAHHDVSLTPDGRLLTLVMGRRRVPAIDPDVDIADDALTLVSLDGKVLESVSLYDVLASSNGGFTIHKAGDHDTGKRGVIDLFHSNALRSASVPELAGRHPIYGPDAVIVTLRHQDEIVILDWKTRALLWHWGRGVLSGPHEAAMLPSGRVLVFDNGLSRGWSRVIELDPLAPAELVQFAPGGSKFFDRVMGSCQGLPNGNTLIVHSEGGAAFELTRQGQPVWTYEGTLANPEGHRVKLPRMRRIPPSGAAAR